MYWVLYFVGLHVALPHLLDHLLLGVKEGRAWGRYLLRPTLLNIDLTELYPDEASQELARLLLLVPRFDDLYAEFQRESDFWRRNPDLTPPEHPNRERRLKLSLRGSIRFALLQLSLPMLLLCYLPFIEISCAAGMVYAFFDPFYRA